MDDIDNKYGSNSNTAVIIISGNRSNLGIIMNANHEIYQILGFSKQDLIGENISFIMPDLIGAHHNSFLHSYFEKQDQNNTSVLTENLIFPQHLKGYIVPCVKLVRLVPNLDSGVQFLGFLNLARTLDEIRPGDEGLKNEEVLLLLLDEQYKIFGFNVSASRICCNEEEFLHLHRYLECEQKIDFSTIYPELMTSENQELIRSASGVNLIQNIRDLKQALAAEILDYYPDQEMDSSISQR